MLERAATVGIHPIPRASQRTGGVVGGRRSGETRRRKAIQRVAAETLRLIPARLLRALEDDDGRRLRVLIARVWDDGRRVGYSAGLRAQQGRARRAQEARWDGRER